MAVIPLYNAAPKPGCPGHGQRERGGNLVTALSCGAATRPASACDRRDNCLIGHPFWSAKNCASQLFARSYGT